MSLMAASNERYLHIVAAPCIFHVENCPSPLPDSNQIGSFSIVELFQLLIDS